MIHLIISGHGDFASGLLSGARLLCGDQAACDAINFNEGMSSEVLREKIEACVAAAGDDVPILFLTDILGGTPFRECSTLAATRAQTEVIAGTNLQMLTEALVEREEHSGDVPSFARALIASAKECMVLLSDKLAAAPNASQPAADEDGI